MGTKVSPADASTIEQLQELLEVNLVRTMTDRTRPADLEAGEARTVLGALLDMARSEGLEHKARKLLGPGVAFPDPTPVKTTGKTKTPASNSARTVASKAPASKTGAPKSAKAGAPGAADATRGAEAPPAPVKAAPPRPDPAAGITEKQLVYLISLCEELNITGADLGDLLRSKGGGVDSPTALGRREASAVIDALVARRKPAAAGSPGSPSAGSPGAGSPAAGSPAAGSPTAPASRAMKPAAPTDGLDPEQRARAEAAWKSLEETGWAAAIPERTRATVRERFFKEFARNRTAKDAVARALADYVIGDHECIEGEGDYVDLVVALGEASRGAFAPTLVTARFAPKAYDVAFVVAKKQFRVALAPSERIQPELWKVIDEALAYAGSDKRLQFLAEGEAVVFLSDAIWERARAAGLV